MNLVTRFMQNVGRRMKDFSGLAEGATYLWPRWIVIRAVGVVYMFVFWGIILEAQALIGPDGIIPVPSLLKHLLEVFPSATAAFFRAPSLLWINASAGMITALGWVGMAAAVAAVLNLWPRMALFACWLIFLSFVAVFGVFSPTVIDPLMLETAILCIPYAPKGFRPGLGAGSPPLPIALFMVRWLVFRVMFESGLSKLISGDPRWRDLTAMNVMYETAPFPTIMAFFDHQMPYAYHLFEIFLTYVADLVGPVLAVFCGRRGRWFAIVAWFMLQGGIQLTANFGWLNFAAIGVSLLFLDDQMLISLAKRLRLNRLKELFAATALPRPKVTIKPWRLGLLRGALWSHFGLTIYAFILWITLGAVDFSDDTTRPLRYGFSDFRIANPYTPYATFLSERFGVEFMGSNDGGVTWRPYRYPHLPQEPDQIVSFVAPRFLRFEAAAQIIGSVTDRTPTFSLIALRLLEQNQRTIGLFKDNPFPDQRPSMIRMRRFQLKYTDLATYRATGNFWTKEYLDDYGPMIYINQEGLPKQASTGLEATQAQADYGNPQAQTYLGTLYLLGRGVPRDIAQAEKWYRLAAEQGFAGAQFSLGALYATEPSMHAKRRESVRWFRLAADQGWLDAQLNLAVMYEKGELVPFDATESARWYQLAAEQGSSEAQFKLGGIYFAGKGVPKDEIEALVWFDLAAQSGDEDAIANRAVLTERLGAAATRVALEKSQQYQERIKQLRANP
uniref:lipase maturation factor family protein n=1 Tax=Cephaloticoccus sp. TaxID=1985742 RepID=UPI00404B0667